MLILLIVTFNFLQSEEKKAKSSDEVIVSESVPVSIIILLILRCINHIMM